MDLALNNLQRLICHKTQTYNPPTNHLFELMLRGSWIDFMMGVAISVVPTQLLVGHNSSAVQLRVVFLSILVALVLISMMSFGLVFFDLIFVELGFSFVSILSNGLNLFLVSIWIGIGGLWINLRVLIFSVASAEPFILDWGKGSSFVGGDRFLRFSFFASVFVSEWEI